jgi:hypothetical protein
MVSGLSQNLQITSPFQPLLVMLSFVAITLYQINQSQKKIRGILAFQRYLNLLFLRRP